MSFWKTPFGKYTFNNLIAIDQWLNAIAGGCPDETCSSRIGRIKLANSGKIPARYIIPNILDPILSFIEKDHSVNAIEYDELEQIKKESLQDGNVYTTKKE